MKFADLLLRGLGVGRGGYKDIYYAFFGNVVRGEIALFRLVVRNGFAHFVRKVFARRKLLPGKFWVFPPLDVMLVAPCCLPVSATALALLSAISYWLWQNVVSKHPKTKSKDIFYLKNQELSQYMSSWKGSFNFALSSVSLWQLAIHLDISTIF